MSKTPSSKFIQVLLKHPNHKGACDLYLGVFCVGGKSLLSASILSRRGGWGGTVYCLTNLEASTPEEVLYLLGLNHLNLEGTASVATRDGDSALLFKHAYSPSFEAHANNALLKTGDGTLQSTFTAYLAAHEERGSEDIADEDISSKSVLMAPLTQLSHMDSAGVTQYETLTDLSGLLNKVTDFRLYTADSVHHPSKNHRLGFVCTDGHGLVYVPDEDIMEDRKLHVDQYVLKSIKGRGYTVLDLLHTEGGERGMQGFLPTGEGFSVVWGDRDGAPLGYDAISGVYNEDAGPACSLDFLLSLVDKPSQVNKYFLGTLITQDATLPATQRWFSALGSEEGSSTTYSVVSISDPEVVDVNLFDYEKTESTSEGLLYRLSVIDGALLKPFVTSSLPKEYDFTVYAGAFGNAKTPWSISTNTCGFDPHTASCLAMPRHVALDSFSASSRRLLGVL